MHEEMTAGDFIKRLWERFCEEREKRPLKHVASLKGNEGTERREERQDNGMALELALAHGWAEPRDVRMAKEVLRRNEAARIVHEFLKCELGEADEEHWEGAIKLRDLYDCHTCVGHVAQVFCKGIMPAKGQVFGMRESVSRKEAEEILDRLFAPGRKQRAGGQSNVPVQLSYGEAKEFLLSHADAAFFDVRTRGEYDRWHPEGAVSWPLISLLGSHEVAGTDLFRPILLGCDGGYRSAIAARCLSDEGYRNVYYCGWESF